jgi:hypothetical protein
MTRSIVALSLAAGLCAVSVAPANAGRSGGGGFPGGFHGGFPGGFHGGFPGGFHGGFPGGFHGGFRGGCCFRGGFWWPGVAFGFGLGAIAAAPYWYPPPVYFAPPPVVYAPPQAFFQPPPQAFGQAPGGGGGQSCFAGAYVCPMDRPVATGASCACPGNNGQRVGGRAN